MLSVCNLLCIYIFSAQLGLKVYNHGCVYIFHGQTHFYLRLLTLELSTKSCYLLIHLFPNTRYLTKNHILYELRSRDRNVSWLNTLRVTMEFPPVWLDERDFGDIKVMISIQNENALHLLLKYCAMRWSKSVIVYL